MFNYGLQASTRQEVSDFGYTFKPHIESPDDITHYLDLNDKKALFVCAYGYPMFPLIKGSDVVSFDSAIEPVIWNTLIRNLLQNKDYGLAMDLFFKAMTDLPHALLMDIPVKYAGIARKCVEKYNEESKSWSGRRLIDIYPILRDKETFLKASEPEWEIRHAELLDVLDGTGYDAIFISSIRSWMKYFLRTFEQYEEELDEKLRNSVNPGGTFYETIIHGFQIEMPDPSKYPDFVITHNKSVNNRATTIVLGKRNEFQ